MRALWAPVEVTDFEASDRFYGAVLDLARLDEWRRECEWGAVYGVGAGGRIEIVQTDTLADPPPVALELASRSDVDDLYERMIAEVARQSSPESVFERATAGQLPRSSDLPGHPAVFPRGHYGFITRDPDGNRLLIWSET